MRTASTRRRRSLTSFLFLVSRGLAAGIVLYAPAIVLSVIMGWDEKVTIMIMGVITIAYTMAGGITAVIWTDVIQMLMMFVGIAAALVILFGTLPPEVGVGDVVYIGGIQEMWSSIDWSWDPTNTYTIWSGMIGGFFLALAYFGTDQSQVQRYLTAKSLRSSRLSLIFNAFLKLPMQFAILSIGVLLFVFYHFERPPLLFNSAEVTMVHESVRGAEFQRLELEHGDVHSLRRQATLELLDARSGGEDLSVLQQRIGEYDGQLAGLRSDAKAIVSEVRGASSNDVNYVFPSYLIRYVPAGILGLMIAVIFAAAMSSLDSELTALSSATVIDFYRRHFRPGADEAHYLLVSRISTFFWGLFACAVALYAGRLGFAPRGRESGGLVLLRLAPGRFSPGVPGQEGERRRGLLGTARGDAGGLRRVDHHRHLVSVLQRGRDADRVGGRDADEPYEGGDGAPRARKIACSTTRA